LCGRGVQETSVVCLRGRVWETTLRLEEDIMELSSFITNWRSWFPIDVLFILFFYICVWSAHFRIYVGNRLFFSQERSQSRYLGNLARWLRDSSEAQEVSYLKQTLPSKWSWSHDIATKCYGLRLNIATKCTWHNELNINTLLSSLVYC